MARFIIQPHGRLNDWVAEENGYLADEGLDYWINVDANHKQLPQLAETLMADGSIKADLIGAFEL